MDFISGLPTTKKGNNAIWVIVDRLTKSAHFISMKTGSKMHMAPLAELFMNEIVSRHGQPISNTLDRDSIFVSIFWKTLLESMGTKLQFSTVYHPQTMVNQNGLYRLLKTCYMPMCQISRFSGMNTCYYVSLRIIIATTPASVWHLSKRFMAEHAKPQFTGKKSVFVAFTDR